MPAFESGPPRPSRLYWICQAAGWGGFLAYVLGGYLAFAPRPRTVDIVSIVLVNGLVCPALTHGLRKRIYRHGWMQLRLPALLRRTIPVVVVLATTVTLLVWAVERLTGAPVTPVALFWTFIAFCLAFAGWILIYLAVHARRRHDLLAAAMRDAQLRTLRGQVNPHFLFNSLNSLRGLIVEDPARAADMVTSLADLLRYSLAADRADTVTLAEELDVIDQYVAVERVRFDDRLAVERSIDPAALAARVPPMLIQTLVENAVKHGISELPQGGIVRVEARATNGMVTIVVANTGRLRDETKDSGLGLRNAAERLRLLYGSVASLTLREHDGTTVASVTVPLDRTA